MAEREWLETYGGRNVMEKKRKRRVSDIGDFSLLVCVLHAGICSVKAAQTSGKGKQTGKQ